ncbi:MAG: rhombosortase [Pseudomonadota bacterium]
MTAPDPVHTLRPRPRSGLWVLGILAFIIAVSAFLPSHVADVFAYFRSKLPVEAWRLVSAHLVHLNWQHALMNALALALLAALVGRCLTARQWAWFWFTASVFVSVGLWIVLPDLERYVGASGVLHGVAALGGIAMFREHRLESVLLLGGLIVKIGWEVQFGATAATAELIGGNVIEQAHWFGAVYGALVGGIFWAFRRGSQL